MSNLKSYHENWLTIHPQRSREWLKKQLRDGFDIHHLDRDHNNDCPENLVLIECDDHMRIHGGGLLGRFSMIKKKKGPSYELLQFGKMAYEEMMKINTSWGEIGEILGIKFANRGEQCSRAAKVYATTNNLKWPIKRLPKHS